MKQSNISLEDLFNKSLEQHTTSVDFESVWNASCKQTINKRKRITLPFAAALTAIMIFTMGFTYTVIRNIDRTDYAFVSDPNLQGKWDTVDIVDRVEDFDSESKHYKFDKSDKIVTSIAFINGGRTLVSLENKNLYLTFFTWTKGMILNKQEKTASKYLLKKIKGTEYMFLQLKGDDYVFYNKTPKFYVLKKVDSEDYSNYQSKVVKQDNIDYPFVDDPVMKGKWECVDYVHEIERFKPGEKSWPVDLFLKELEFGDKGKLSGTTTSLSNYGVLITWTKGFVLDKRYGTASKCEIKEIDGTIYMFYEWKSGDYIYGGRNPGYYVFKKKD